MIYNVVMSPLRGFGSWWAPLFVGVNPYAVLCRPFGAFFLGGGGTLSAGIRGFVPNALALLKLSACKVTTFFLNMQILLGQIAFFAVFLWFCGK